MNPISDEQFSHDYEKFVLQNPNVNQVDMFHRPRKPFSIEKKTEKTRKPLNKKNEKEEDKGQKKDDEEKEEKEWSPFG